MDRSSPTAKTYRGIVLLVIVLVPLIYFGFRASYWDHFPRFGGVGWEVHFHLLTIAAWLVMLVAQAWLAVKGRIEQHKRIGRLSYFLVPLMVIGFGMVTNYGQLRHKQPDLLGATLFDGCAFLVFYILAVVYRKNTAYHSRYMMLTAVPFINPTLGRAVAPELSTTVEFVLIIALLIDTRIRKTAWQPYLVALLVMILLMAVIIYASVIEPGVIEAFWTAAWG